MSSVTTNWSARLEKDKPVWEKAAACEITALCWIQSWGDTRVFPTKQKLWEQGMASPTFPVQHLARGDQAPRSPVGVLVVQKQDIVNNPQNTDTKNDGGSFVCWKLTWGDPQFSSCDKHEKYLTTSREPLLSKKSKHTQEITSEGFRD